MDERLEQIAQLMEALTTHDDPEVAHAEADALLLEAIDKLMTKENSVILNRITEAYSSVGKWYA
jgi:hypothetical protein